MKQILLFTLSFVALTMLGTWLWMAGGDVLYDRALGPIARELYALLGIEGRGSFRRTRFINLVPFTALMLLTPGLGTRRRARGLLLGWLVLVGSHLALNGYAMASQARGNLPLFAAQLSDALPFLLWLVLARDFVAGHIRRARSRARRGPAANLGADPRSDPSADAGMHAEPADSADREADTEAARSATPVADPGSGGPDARPYPDRSDA